MKYIFYSLFSFILLISCQNKTEKQIIKVVNYEELQNIVDKSNNVLYVINFWATWCLPCVQELPDFVAVNKKYENHANFKMILVSLDKAIDLNTKVKPFIEKNR